MTTKVSIGLGGTGSNSAASTLTSIGAVAKSGDTMTGQLNISSGGLLVTGTANVSANVAVGAGSQTAPSLTRSGDTDTGIYFPANNEMAITVGGTVAQAFNSGGVFFRNRIINGDMRIDQRNAGANVSINNTAQYTLDRWYDRSVGGSGTGVISVQQSTTAPTGFINSHLTTVTTSKTPAASEQFWFFQAIEGTNIADLGWGAAGASTVTLSFWVRASVTGSYSIALQNSGQARSYVANYVVNAANTWEYKTITISGDTTGTWLTTNGVGIYIFFDTGSGSNYQTTANAWAAGTYYRTSGSVQLIANSGATHYITGVQLETGSVATPFERRPFGTELQLCQRYYYRMTNSIAFRVACGTFYTGTLFLATFNYPVTMRAAPTGSVSAAADFAAEGNAASYYASAFSFSNLSSQSCRLDLTVSGGTQGYGGNVFGEANKSIAFSAEL